MKRYPLSLCLPLSLLCGSFSAALAQTSITHQAHSPAMTRHAAPSFGVVHITPTTMAANASSIEDSSEMWAARGLDLKSLIAQIYDVDPRRIDIPEGADLHSRFDVTLLLTASQSDEQRQQLLRHALETHFNLTITPEVRSMDVYVLTAPNGPGPSLHAHRPSMAAVANGAADDLDAGLENAPKFTFQGQLCSAVYSGSISVSTATIPQFSQSLEPSMDRLLVDETHLSGIYDFEIPHFQGKDQLLQQLNKQLGLVVAPTQRNLTIWKVRSAADSEVASLR